jgi:glyoxylase-like metal-dependent hydrolase (beta-lactamase superfamily II)
VRAADFRVISIGTLAAHPLWDETADVRTGHATTTLVTAGDVRILVDPSLPGQIIEARLGERSGTAPDDVTHVFLTAFTVEHYRGLSRFEHAHWLLHEPERDAAAAALEEQRERARDLGDADIVRMVETHRALLGRCGAAPDRIAPGVDLFPLPGVTPGTCGLIIPLAAATVLVCGDAVATVEHLRQAKVLPTSADVERAQESFREAIEIADILVPGRDNVVHNPLKQMA